MLFLPSGKGSCFLAAGCSRPPRAVLQGQREVARAVQDACDWACFPVQLLAAPGKLKPFPSEGSETLLGVLELGAVGLGEVSIPHLPRGC